MSLLVSTTFSGGTHAWVGSWTNISGTNIALPAIIRPVPLLILGTISCWVPDAGNATYAMVRMAVVSSIASATVINDISGNPMRSSMAFVTRGGTCVAGVEQGAVLTTASLAIAAVAPTAGASGLIAMFQYVMFDGATSVLDLPSAIGGIDTGGIQVFQLAG